MICTLASSYNTYARSLLVDVNAATLLAELVKLVTLYMCPLPSDKDPRLLKLVLRPNYIRCVTDLCHLECFQEFCRPRQTVSIEIVETDDIHTTVRNNENYW